MEGNNRILIKLKSGDETEKNRIAKKFNLRLFTYFKARIKGDIDYEDLVQEVFVSFFNAVGKDKIIGDEYIAPFIFGIAKRVVYNFFYKEKKRENIRKKVEIEYTPFMSFSGEKELQNDRLVKLVNIHIDRLKNIDKIILKEFYIKENTIENISVLINKSRHYVSVRKDRALKKIKTEIINNEDLFNLRRTE